MSKLTSLLKASTSGGLQLFNYRGKTEQSRRIMPILLGVLMGTMMLLSGTAMMIGLKEDGIETAILSLYTLVTTVVIVMEGSYKAGDLLFKPKDNDILLAMPIKRSTIVMARMIRFYLFEMVYCLIFLLPAIIAYAINVEVEASFYLAAFTMLLLVPVIPVAIGCFAGLVISAVSGKFKHKTLLQVILSFVMMFGVTGLVLLANTSSDLDGRGMIMISDKITEYYYPASTFVNLVKHFDILEYLIFVAANLLILIITALIISHYCFQIINGLGAVNRVENTNTNYQFTRHSQISAMVRKEITRYFNTPVLLVNTAMGLVFFAVTVGALCLKFDELANSLIASMEEFPLTIDEMRTFLPTVTLAMVAFASLLTCITATMISLEGRTINILKALPISGVKVEVSKVLAAVFLIVPVTAAGSLAMAIRFHFGIMETILVMIGVVAIPFVTELIGILINLKYPRFDADSDTIVVRQSASVMVATFLGLGMVLVTISLIFTTVFFAGQIAGLAIMDAVYVIVALFLYFTVAMRGEEKYMRLSI